MRRRAALAVAVLTLTAAAPAAAEDRTVPSTVLFGLADNDVFESSGLVDEGSLVWTTNDSGDDAVLYGLDPRTGRTVARTTYADEVEDVEALAPGRNGTVWAGDVGDNPGHRDSVQVYRVRPAPSGDADRRAPRYDLTYPGGARNAETLLVQPRTQRVFVVSKSAFGGTVYAAPRTLHEGRTNRLTEFARVAGLVTDGAFFPDGRHVVLRTYSTASVYTFPGFQLTGTVRLPSQPQGEGISVSRTGRVLVSSEGTHANVLRVRLPAGLTAVAAPSAGPSDTSGPAPATAGPAVGSTGPPRHRTLEQWGWVALSLAAVVALGYVLTSAVRPRSRRTR